MRDFAKFEKINHNQDVLKARVDEISVKHEKSNAKSSLAKKADECAQYEKVRAFCVNCSCLTGCLES